MNNVCITGRIYGPLELRFTKDGVAMTTFTVLVARPRVKNVTDLINCIAWRSSAEFITSNFSTGDMIEIVGVLNTHDKKMQDGTSQREMEVVCNTASWIKPGKFKSNAEAELTDKEAVNASIDAAIGTLVDMHREIYKDTGELPF